MSCLFLCLFLGFFLECGGEVVESFGCFFVRPDVVVGVFGFVLAEGAGGCAGCFSHQCRLVFLQWCRFV